MLFAGRWFSTPSLTGNLNPLSADYAEELRASWYLGFGRAQGRLNECFRLSLLEDVLLGSEEAGEPKQATKVTSKDLQKGTVLSWGFQGETQLS